MGSRLEIRDPIHGFIHREKTEQQIIDTKVFQRLRRIKELALASLVYPGANHTRFEHSLGAMHIAGRIASKLELPHDEQRIVRLAALLHDVGHGPFSHVSEEVLQGVTGNKQAHEQLTHQIILQRSDFNDPLSGDDRRRIVGLLKGERGDQLLRSMLSGPLDVDKQDYLLRDSYYCGVKYGVYDIDRLIETLRIHPDRNERILAISEDGTQTLEQFVIARYHMTGQVYRHRLRLITDSMIVRGLSLGIDVDELAWLKDLYSYSETDEYLENYLSWDDERLTRTILSSETRNGYAKTIFERLANRKLFKQIFTVRVEDLAPHAKSALLEDDPIELNQIQSGLETEVAKIIPEVDERLVIAKIIRLKSPAQTEASVLVVGKDRSSPREFGDASSLFGSINAAIQDQRIDIYAPVTWIDDSDKKQKLEKYQKEIQPMLNDLLKSKSGLFKGEVAVAAGSDSKPRGDVGHEEK